MNSQLTARQGSFDVGQCGRRSRRCPYHHVPLYFAAEITNWLPQVNIPYLHLVTILNTPSLGPIQ